MQSVCYVCSIEVDISTYICQPGCDYTVYWDRSNDERVGGGNRGGVKSQFEKLYWMRTDEFH